MTASANLVTPFPRVDRRFRLTASIAALAAVALFGCVLFVGRGELEDRRGGSDFYDAQVRSWFDGRWDVPREVLSIEAFEIEGKTYTYFGPVPAVLRVPVLAVTDRFDGRLSQPSMLVAYAVALVAMVHLVWRTRVLLRGEDTMGWPEATVSAALVFVLAAGSTLLYLGSQAVVYHEAILWSVALALASSVALIGFLRCPSRRSLGSASIFASLAFLTRGSVGLGPVVALGLVFVVYLVAVAASTGSRKGREPPAPLRWLVPSLRLPLPPRHLVALAVAALAPIVLYAAVNQAKFGSPYEIPVDQQVFSDIDPARQAALADNGGSLFGLRYVPTTAAQYLRPDALDLEPVPPYLEFPRSRPVVVGDVVFDTFDEASSVPATMPLLLVLSVVGLGAVLLWPVGGRDADARPPAPAPAPVEGGGLRALRLPVAGAAVGAMLMLTIAFVAHRYIGDALPLLVLLSVAGFEWLATRLAGVRTAFVTAALVIGGVLGIFGVAANLALALEYQRLIAPADLDTRYEFVRLQYDDGGTHRVDVVDAVPEVRPRGSIVVVGECEALLWSDGTSWYPLEGRTGPDGTGGGALGGAGEVIADPSSERGSRLCERLVDRLR